MAAALDAAAGALLAVWEAARERTTSRLSGAQLRAVMVVEQHDGINLRRLATLLDMLLSSASRLCDRLVAAGMLEREPGRFDRREISLHLTPEAQRLLAELRTERRQRLDRRPRRDERRRAARRCCAACGSSTGPPAGSRRRRRRPAGARAAGRVRRSGAPGPAGAPGDPGGAGAPGDPGRAGAPERPGGLAEWSTGEPPVARTA